VQKPTSNVKPLTGNNLPRTGNGTENGLWFVLGLALLGTVAGVGLRRRAMPTR